MNEPKPSGIKRVSFGDAHTSLESIRLLVATVNALSARVSTCESALLVEFEGRVASLEKRVASLEEKSK